MHHQVSSRGSKHQIMWQEIPGYLQILRAFTQEMQNIDIKDYPDAFIEASLVLLSN